MLTHKIHYPEFLIAGHLLQVEASGNYVIYLGEGDAGQMKVRSVDSGNVRWGEVDEFRLCHDVRDAPPHVYSAWYKFREARLCDAAPGEPDSAFSTQEGGEHYSSLPDGYQPFQISKVLQLNPVEHTILKYLLRHRRKNKAEDLRKIKHCVDILIEQEYRDA